MGWQSVLLCLYGFHLLSLVLTQQIVLTSNYQPQVYCNETFTQDQYDGIDIRFFRSLVDEMSWNISDFEFQCGDYYAQLDHINDTNVFCAMGGITILEQILSSGSKFSQPYINTGASLLVKAKTITWPFLLVYSWEVIIILGLVNLVILSFVSQWLEGNRLPVVEYCWHNLSHLFINGTLIQNHFEGKIIDLFQLAMNIVVTLIFTARIVNIYAEKNDFDTITSVSQAYGKRIASWTGYNGMVSAIGG